VAAEERDLLAGFEITIGTAFGKMSNLRAGRGRDENKRGSAHELLH
jgi:hypothetical protein